MKPIHNLLRQRLYRTQKPLLEHPPIDLLSAFSERALSGSDSAPLLAHLAQCSECREIIFLAAPGVSAWFPEAASSPSASRWISWPVFRWGTVAACAVMVVAAMRLRPANHPTYTQVVTATREAQKPSGAITNEPSSPAMEAQAERAPGTNPAPARRFHAIPGKAKDAPHIPANQSGGAFATDGILNKSTSKLPPRWTLTADGALQRSLDGGITWQHIQVSHDRVFRSVAAVGSAVWLGGKKGVLFHSSDAGRHWTQMKGTGKSPLPDSDIVGIQFEDDQHGKLTTASNESWRTSDAGRSWEKQ